jgi:nucleotide-binding universal stress UspA family protein
MMRFPPRRVLVAVDMSEPALHAWRAAREIAERFGSRLDAVYCEPPLAPELEAYSAETGSPSKRQSAREALRRRFGDDAPLHLVRGDPAATLAKLARDRGADLIVCGTHRRKGVARVVMGSVAESLALASPCPVLIVPRRARPPRWVLAPVNDAPYAQAALNGAGVIARAYKARLALVHVPVDPIFGPRPQRLLESRLESMPDEIRRDTKPTAEVHLGDPIADILRSTRGRDLVVLAARRKPLLGDWVLGATVQRVIRHSPIPVLAIPTKP